MFHRSRTIRNVAVKISRFETDNSMLGQCKAFIKSEIAMIPFLGWAMWFNEFGFLTRAKASKDLKTLQRASEHFRGQSHFYNRESTQIVDLILPSQPKHPRISKRCHF